MSIYVPSLSPGACNVDRRAGISKRYCFDWSRSRLDTIMLSFIIKGKKPMYNGICKRVVDTGAIHASE